MQTACDSLIKQVTYIYETECPFVTFTKDAICVGMSYVHSEQTKRVTVLNLPQGGVVKKGFIFCNRFPDISSNWGPVTEG